jgi:D-alanine-D-alanine ligase
MEVSVCSKLDVEKWGHVAVVMGGPSAERDVSLKSGRAVLTALLARGVNATAVEVKGDLVNPFLAGSFDRVVNVIHGRGGEDGVIQGVLESLNIPYSGSGVLASAICMDKLRTKWCLKGAGLTTPQWYTLTSKQDFETCVEQLGFPMIIKPVREGSSIGMSRVNNVAELGAGYRLASEFDSSVYAEAWVDGEEYSVGLIAGQVLPVIRVKTPNSFYDYEAKYLSNSTEYFCPSGLTKVKEERLMKLAEKAFEVVGVTGWGRVDLFIDHDDQDQLIEINTVPGMTDHSLLPMAAKVAGIDFDELVMRILESSIDVDS